MTGIGAGLLLLLLPALAGCVRLQAAQPPNVTAGLAADGIAEPAAPPAETEKAADQAAAALAASSSSPSARADEVSAPTAAPEGGAGAGSVHFPDVDDVDKRPEGSRTAAGKTGDWDSKEDQQIAKPGEVWEDPSMHSHNPAGPAPPKATSKEPRCFADLTEYPDNKTWHQLIGALSGHVEKFRLGCHFSRRMWDCDPIADKLGHIRDHLKRAFRGNNWWFPFNNTWTEQVFVNKLKDVSQEMSFTELWDTLNEGKGNEHDQISQELTPHALWTMNDNPFYRYGMDRNCVEYMFHIGDHDMSGGLSYGELRQYIVTLAEVMYLPFHSSWFQHGKQYDVDRQKLEEWVGEFHSHR